MVFTLIIIVAVLALADGEYNYQQPNTPYYPQLLNQGRLPVNQQHYIQPPQAFIHTPQNLHHGSVSHVGNFLYNHNSYNQIPNPMPVVSSNNYYHNVPNPNPQNLQQASLNSVSATPAQPIVKKHIYFHVAPPDEPASAAPAPAPIKKKTIYNLIFVKVPSQRPGYYKDAQGFSVNPYVPVEAKTVIYVLVKKPDDQDQERAKSPPNHEVYYVKYKGSANGVATQINKGLSQVVPVQTLRPGLVNGQE